MSEPADPPKLQGGYGTRQGQGVLRESEDGYELVMPKSFAWVFTVIGAFCALIGVVVFIIVFNASDKPDPVWLYVPPLIAMLPALFLPLFGWSFYYSRRHAGPYVSINLHRRTLYSDHAKTKWSLDEIDMIRCVEGYVDLYPDDRFSDSRTVLREIQVLIEGQAHVAYEQSYPVHKHARKIAEVSGLPYQRIKLRKDRHDVVDTYTPRALRY